MKFIHISVCNNIFKRLLPKQTNFSSGVFYFSPIDVIILVGYNIALVRALLLIEQQL